MKLVHRVLTLFLALPGLPVIAGMSVAPMEKVFMQDNRPMELVGKLNQLDFGNDSREDIDIPEVAVVGTQSAGKSTVVSRLLGNIRLFSSEELATAVPTKIHSLNVPEERLNFTLWIDGQKDASRATDRLDEVSTIFLELQSEILARDGEEISETPVHINMRGENCTNLEIIDLPGLQVAGDSETKIADITRKYLSRENILVISVLSVGTDINLNHATKVLKQYRPQRGSALVMTKADTLLEAKQGKIAKIKKYLDLEDSEGVVSSESGYQAFLLANQDGQTVLSEQEETEILRSLGHFDSEVYEGQLGIGALREYLAKTIVSKIPRGFRLNRQIDSLNEKIENYKEQLLALQEKNNPDARAALLWSKCTQVDSQIKTNLGKNKNAGKIYGDESFAQRLQSEALNLKKELTSKIPAYQILEKLDSLTDKIEMYDVHNAQNRKEIDKFERKLSRKRKSFQGKSNSEDHDDEEQVGVLALQKDLQKQVDQAYEELENTVKEIIESAKVALSSTVQIGTQQWIQPSAYENMSLNTIGSWEIPAKKFVRTMCSAGKTSVEEIIRCNFEAELAEKLVGHVNYFAKDLSKSILTKALEQLEREKTDVFSDDPKEIEEMGKDLAKLLYLGSGQEGFKERFIEALRNREERIKVVAKGAGILAAGVAFGGLVISAIPLGGTGLLLGGSLLTGGLVAGGQGKMVAKGAGAGIQAGVKVAKKVGRYGHDQYQQATVKDHQKSGTEKKHLMRSLSIRKKSDSKKKQAKDVSRFEEREMRTERAIDESELRLENDVIKTFCESSAYNLQARDRVETNLRQFMVVDYVNGVFDAYSRGVRDFQKEIENGEMDLTQSSSAKEEHDIKRKIDELQTAVRLIGELRETLK